jgi:hypothetical protein
MINEFLLLNLNTTLTATEVICSYKFKELKLLKKLRYFRQ